MLPPCYELVLLQSLIDMRDQLLCRLSHVNAMRPHTPPKCKLTIDVLRGGIGQDRCTRSIRGDEVSGGTRTGKDDDGLDTGLLCQCASCMADRMCRGQALALRLTSATRVGLSLLSNTHHHLNRLQRIGTR